MTDNCLRDSHIGASSASSGKPTAAAHPLNGAYCTVEMSGVPSSDTVRRIPVPRLLICSTSTGTSGLPANSSLRCERIIWRPLRSTMETTQSLGTPGSSITGVKCLEYRLATSAHFTVPLRETGTATAANS